MVNFPKSFLTLSDNEIYSYYVKALLAQIYVQIEVPTLIIIKNNKGLMSQNILLCQLGGVMSRANYADSFTIPPLQLIPVFIALCAISGSRFDPFPSN